MTASLSSYLLVDTAMLGGTEAYLPSDALSWPNWVHPVYENTAVIVTPLVVDIASAYEAGDLDLAMRMMNAERPQLHVSIIDTPLPAAALAEHLRRLIWVRTGPDKHSTLRFADSFVLAALSDVLTPAQWRTLTDGVVSWRVHQLDESLAILPCAGESEVSMATPLELTARQVDELKELLAPARLIAALRNLYPDRVMRGNAAQRFDLAARARKIWLGTDADEVILLSLVGAAVDTEGAILDEPRLVELLDFPDRASVEEELRAATENLMRSDEGEKS